MTDEFKIIKKLFHHDIVEGTHYEIGKQQGETFRKRYPNSPIDYISKDSDPTKRGFKDFKEQQEYFEQYCPGITEEFAGFADGLGIKHKDLSLYDPPIFVGSNCSQFTANPSITKDDHVYVGRSYEYNQTEDDFRLLTTRIKGKAKTIGFSCFTLGRLDGLNEHGFCVTFTGGGTFKTKPKSNGFAFFLITRSLLDNCKTVDEAVNFLEEVPVNGFWNFLVTDKKGNAALAQFFDDDYEIKRIGDDTKEKHIFSGNHYRLPKLEKYQEFAGDWILRNSKKRCEVIETTLSSKSPNISKDDFRTLLSKPLYEGVSGYYYTDYFGTLFSALFDLTDLKMDICFGIPTHNDWKQAFSFDGSVGSKEYQAIFPDKSIKNDELWCD